MNLFHPVRLRHFAAGASTLNGLCPTGTPIMGEGSLDDQLRGEVMWSSFTDAVDMSNSSSSLSTEERHSHAPGSVSKHLNPNKPTKNPDEPEKWEFGQNVEYICCRGPLSGLDHSSCSSHFQFQIYLFFGHFFSNVIKGQQPLK